MNKIDLRIVIVNGKKALNGQWILIVSLLIFSGAHAQGTITVTGQWSLTIDQSHLVSGPGSDLIDTYESATNQVLINVNGPDRTWRVDVHRVDITWHSDFILEVRRQANNQIIGGLTYQIITPVAQQFFRSNNRRRVNNIRVQFRLSGVSININPNTYSTTVVYTLVNI